MRQPIVVDFDTLRHDVEVLKLKKAEIQTKYGLPTVAATTRLLKEAGLKIRPTRFPVFTLNRNSGGTVSDSPVTDVVYAEQREEAFLQTNN